MDLVSIDTSKKENYRKAVEVIKKYIKEIGLEYCIEEEDGTPNIKIFYPGEGPEILLVMHYDVVPATGYWKFDPFKPFIKDGKLFGRGAADDKSAIAATLAAFYELKKEGVIGENKVTAVIVGDEETGGCISYLKKLKGDAAVVLDSTNKIIVGASGVVWMEVEVKGKGAHAGMPAAARNPIYDAAELILALRDYAKALEKEKVSSYKAPEYYEYVPARLSVSVIHAGSAPNIIPDKCVLKLDRRVHPEEDIKAAEEELRKFIEGFCREKGIEANVKTIMVHPGYATKDKKVIEWFRSVVKEAGGEWENIYCSLGGNDGAYLADRMPVVCFGAMRPENNIHAPNEFVYLEDVELLKKVVKEIIKKRLC